MNRTEDSKAFVLAELSSRALTIVAVVNLLMGAILAFVRAVQLKTFGAGIYVAHLAGIASVRELTPILAAIVLAGRTGGSFPARIATMQGNEEIDALTTLGISSVEFLVLPRVLALSLLMPLLYVDKCAFALLGGLLVSTPILDISATVHAKRTPAGGRGGRTGVQVAIDRATPPGRRRRYYRSADARLAEVLAAELRCDLPV